MIGNIIFAFIFGIIIGYVLFLMKRRRDAVKSLKRITENNVGRFNLDEEEVKRLQKEREEQLKLQKEREKEMKGGKEKENGKNREAVGLPKPKEGPTNPSDAKQ